MRGRALIGVAVFVLSSSVTAADAPHAPTGSTILYVSMEVIGDGGRGDDCGAITDSSITANVGDHVHVCWFGQNNTAGDLTVHSIGDSLDGEIFSDFDLDIPATQMQLLADFRITVKQSLDVTETWTARADLGADPFIATATTHIEALQPTLALDATSLTASANAGEIVRGALNLSNAGTADLAWHFGEAEMPGAPADGSKKTASMHAMTPPSGASIPAYAVRYTGGGTELVSLDMAAPGAPVGLPGTLPGSISGGTFVDGDESREVLLSDTAGLIAIDLATGAVDTINPATAPDPGDSGWLAMAWDPIDHALYALSTNDTLPSLYSIDPSTGATTRLGEINDRTLTINGVYTALAADSDGRLFAIDGTNSLLVAVARDQYSLDGRVSGYTVGALGIDTLGLSALAFDAATNTLYLAATPPGGVGTMYTVDTITGAATPVGTIGSGKSYVAMSAVASARPCGVARDVAWLSLDTYIEPPLGPGASEQIGVIFDATDLDAGEYDANLCLHTNDATRRKVPIPVHLTVGANRDAIFGASFEGGAP